MLEESGISPHHPVQVKLKLLAPTHRGCTREPRLGAGARGEHERAMAQPMRSTEQEILEGSDVVGAEAQRHMGRGRLATVGDQESGARESAQQAQVGPGDKMVESSERQIAGALVDGSFTHKTAAPAAAATAIRAAPNAPSQDCEEGANERWKRRNLDNGYPDTWREPVARPQRRALEGADGAGQVTQARQEKS